ncbi:MAG: class I SAM-dependent methyltransferase [Hyphomicrobiales bacterium]|nr:class I SAM-dependent methyltransferase [Alphaproteobacteria bacterium]
MTGRPVGFFEGTGMPDSGWWKALWPDPAKVLGAVGVAPGMDVIDLCSGDGWFTLPLSRIARRVIAIDIDTALLEAAKTRIAERGVAPNCTFVEADAYDLPKVAPGPVDFILLANAFHGVPDQPRLARAVRDVLKPAGAFAILNWYARPREETIILGEPRGPATELRMTPEQTIASVEPGGLKFRNRVEVSPYHYGAVFERPL